MRKTSVARVGKLLLCALLLAGALLGGYGHSAAHPTAGALLPPGFAITQFTGGLTLPTDMVFLPNGDLLVTEKGGYGVTDGQASVRLVRNGKLLPTPVVTLGVNAEGDSGLLALTIDPDFATNGYFYIWYATGPSSPNYSGESKDRLARLTFDPATDTASLASHLTLIEDVRWHRWHNGGGLAFDANKRLYLSTGDANQTQQARDPAYLNGKVLRIQPTATGYTIPADNPYINRPGARPEVFAVGLRNPFRARFNPVDGLVYVGDVGQKTWEEINRLSAPGLDLGWNLREGPCYFQSTNCTPAPGLTDPVVSYLHVDNGYGSGSSVTGLTVYTGDSFPAQYRGKFFFTDYDRETLQYVDITNNGVIQPFGAEIGGIVDLEQNRGAIYLLEVMTGIVWELRYNGGGNTVPSVTLGVDRQQGKPPLAVTARAEQVVDPDDLVHVYKWDFGDGVTQQTDGPVVSHTYAQDGTYTLALQVVDGRGGASTPVRQRITVYAGEFPTIALENLTTVGGERFRAGDAIRYTAQRSAGTTGLRAQDPYVWSVELHHNDHVHPYESGIPAASGVYTIPLEDHGETTIFFRFGLSMFTAAGQEISVYRDLAPDVVDLALRTDPPTVAGMTMDNGPVTVPTTVTVLINTQHALAAAETLVHERGVYSFTHWVLDGTVDPVTERSVTVTAPPIAPVYTAHYQYVRPADSLFLPEISDR